LLTALAAGTTTLLTSGGVADLAYRSPSLHVALETAVAVISVVAAHLVFGRFRQGSKLNDLLLFYALAAFAISNLLLSALPAAVAISYPKGLATWGPTIGILIAASLLFAAAQAPARRVNRRVWDRIDRVAAALVVGALLGAPVVLARFGTTEHVSLFSPARWGWGDLPPHPEIGLQVVVSILFVAAGFSFARRAEKTGDELMTWLAVGSVLAAFARVNYFIFPSLYSQWVSVGDALRLSFYLILFIGAARELRTYQGRAASAAVLDERRRMARELHDGLAQELAFIAGQTKRLAEISADLVDDQMHVEHLAAAAERALDESRRAIAALSQPALEPFHVAVANEAREVAARVGAELELELATDVEVDPAKREMLLRIVREAVGNAARHGHAGKIVVHLSNGDGVHLTIVDDGVGFDSGALAAGERFGLTSMRERAVAAGAEFRLTTRAGGGTLIEVVLP
jgi:signal transduction histidine kinase